MIDIAVVANRLDHAARVAEPIAQFDPEGRLPLSAAYAVQQAAMQHRLARGEQRVGVKMGFTSRAKMIQMNIDDVIWGRLSNSMAVADGGTTNAGRYIRPRVEPEVAFVLKRDLVGPVSAVEALSAVEAVAPALEIIDSRYKDFKFSLPEVVADNASSSGFVLGNWCSPHTDLSNLGMVLALDGRIVQVGSTSAILGNPIRSLVAAARLCAEVGEPLREGWIVLAGGATAAEWIVAGQYVSLEMERLGRVGFTLAD